jgi:hypothetical protein
MSLQRSVPRGIDMCSVPQVCGVQPCSVPCGFLGFGFPFVFLDFVLLLGVLLYTFGVLRGALHFFYIRYLITYQKSFYMPISYGTNSSQGVYIYIYSK